MDKKIIAYIFTALTLIHLYTNSLVYANSISSDLSSFFTSLGYDNNVTPGSAYQGQAAGYYSGGSIFIRDRVKNLQIINIDPPSLKNGCGGIDLFGGGFSFVNAQALTEFFQKIMSNAGGYMFNLALETAVPELAHAMQFIQNLAQEINANNFNSCELAENMVGGVWPRTKATHQHICKDLGNHSGKFADWAMARQKCGEEDAFNETMNKTGEDKYKEYKNNVMVDKNLIWNALTKSTYIKDLKEFFMSLSGTIIFKGTSKVTIYSPLAKDRKLLKAILEGGKAKIYKCVEEVKCLEINETEIDISKDKALYEKIKITINELVTAVAVDSGTLDTRLQNFLELTKFPLLKFVTTNLMANQDTMAMSIANYSEAIAKNLLMQYMREALLEVENSLKNTDYAPEIHKQLIDQIHRATVYIENIKTESNQDIQELMTFIESSKVTEREVTSKVIGQLKRNLGGGGGL